MSGLQRLKRRLYPAHLWDLFIASDPDLGRLRMGLRAIVSASLAAGIHFTLAHVLGAPPTVPMMGTMTAMMASQLASDAEPRAQRITTGMLAIPALSAVVLGTLSAKVPLLGAAIFAVASFVSTFVRRFGPRGLALGLMGFLSFFTSIFFRAPVSELPVILLTLSLSIVIAYTVRFGLIRDRADRNLRRFVRAFRRTVSLVLWELTGLVVSSRITPAFDRRLRREANRLNDAALAVEDIFDRCHPEFRLRLFELELSADRVLAAVRQVVASGALTPDARREVRHTLGAAHAAVRKGSPEARRAMDAHLEHLQEWVPRSPNPEQARDDVRRFRYSLTDLVNAATQAPLQAPPLTHKQAASKNPPPPANEPPGKGLHPATRQAIQATVATVLAMGAGYALSASRWYWAVVAAFVIFTRTQTLGDTLLRAWYRVLGTLLGVLAGLVLAGMVSGHRDVELASVFVCIFFSYYTIRLSYAWMVFWFTTMLAVLYSLLGRFTPGLLFLRIEETMIGAGIGMLTAAVLLPERMTGYIRSAAMRVLDAVYEYLDLAVGEHSAETSQAQLLDSLRTLDARLRDLRTAARPLSGRATVRFAPKTARTVHSMMALVFSARHLLLGRKTLEAHGELRELLQEIGSLLARNAHELARAMEQQEPPTIESASALLEKARSALEGAAARPQGPVSPPVVLHWLARVDDTLNLLAKTGEPLIPKPHPA